MCSVVVLCYDQARQCASQSDMTQISVLGSQTKRRPSTFSSDGELGYSSIGSRRGLSSVK